MKQQMCIICVCLIALAAPKIRQQREMPWKQPPDPQPPPISN
jgi:hypothetical protein